LRDLSNLEFQITTGAPAGTVPAIWWDAIDMNLNVPTADNFNLRIGGTSQYSFSASSLDMKTNNIDNLSNLNFDNADQSIISLATGIRHDVPTADTHTFRINSANIMVISSTDVLFNQDIDMEGNAIILDADGDTQINSISDDTMQFITGSTLQLQIGNTASTFTGDLTINGDVIPGSGTSDLGTVASIWDDIFVDQTLTNVLTDEDGTGDIRVVADLDLDDGFNITVGTGTGTKIGNSATQKLGFFGATPIVQPSGGITLGDLKTALQNLGLIS